jgi:hypothetical protein
MRFASISSMSIKAKKKKKTIDHLLKLNVGLCWNEHQQPYEMQVGGL